jgi:hypothetical protein
MSIRSLIALGFALWVFPSSAMAAQPSCFASPLPKMVTVAVGNPEPACQLLAKVLESAGGADIAWLPGQIVNSVLKLTEGGFATDTFVLQFRTSTAFSTAFSSGTDELVRLTTTDASARTGSWWVPKGFVTDPSGRWLSVDMIADVLALPPGSDLRQVAYSGAIDPGTVAYVGIVAPAFHHRGGAIQFWFPREPVYTKDIGVPTGVAK